MAARIPLEFGTTAASARPVMSAEVIRSANIPSFVELRKVTPNLESPSRKERDEIADVPAGASNCAAVK
jgi:hypothetical protein